MASPKTANEKIVIAIKISTSVKPSSLLIFTFLTQIREGLRTDCVLNIDTTDSPDTDPFV